MTGGAREQSEERIAALEAEVDQLQRAVASHAVVDQAIGVVIAVGRLRPEQGWEVLKEISQHTNTKLREVAEYVVQGAHCGWLPDEIHHALVSALSRTDPRSGAGEDSGVGSGGNSGLGSGVGSLADPGVGSRGGSRADSH
ncbi:ANTAR domain-containing protein [Streptomyces sp. NPDC002566]|uniref:ANTAR domain-containing protein n=1 Tax=Streptomyces sp. NPDC002566 TaxID=3364650 RepID=UPI0036772558